MRRTSIWLPIDLHDDLRRLAHKRRTSIAELLRIAAQAHFSEELKAVRKDPFRDERLENIGTGRKWSERRWHQRRIEALDKVLPKRRDASG